MDNYERFIRDLYSKGTSTEAIGKNLAEALNKIEAEEKARKQKEEAEKLAKQNRTSTINYYKYDDGIDEDPVLRALHKLTAEVAARNLAWGEDKIKKFNDNMEMNLKTTEALVNEDVVAAIGNLIDEIVSKTEKADTTCKKPAAKATSGWEPVSDSDILTDFLKNL